MNFDQMLDAWKAQDEAPLYGVNRDLLQLVLRHEQARVRRMLRMELWVAFVVGTGMAIFAGVWLWVLIFNQGPVLQTLAAGAAAGVLALWVGAFWLSRRRQARRERDFGNTLQDEVKRSLSLVEYQLANGTRTALMLWTAPALIGAGLIYWLTIEINLDPGESRWDGAWMVMILVAIGFLGPRKSSRSIARKLEPRRQRLRALLATLEGGE